MQKKENLEKNFISAVVYMNSAENESELDTFLVNLVDKLGRLFEKYEIIVVDDDSPATYMEVVRKAKEMYPQTSMTILHMSGYQGMEMSMNAGRDLAIGDYVFEFDECSYNFPDDQIEKVYRACLSDFDIVNCSDAGKNHMGSNMFYSLFNKFSGLEYKLESDNFRILSRRGINRIQSLNRTIPYRKALYANCGLKVETLEYEPVEKGLYEYDRKMKKSRRNLAVDSIILFTDVGFKAAFTLSVLMAVFMVIMAVYAVIMYVGGIAIEGWTTTMLFLSFAFFGLFTIMTIVIKYLSLLLNINFKKHRYMFESIEKI